jgi:DNA polymerase V
VYSIDECFVDLSGLPGLRELSYAMRERVMQWTGIPVCVGIGPTKTLAKLANHVAKKHPRSRGVFNYNALSAEQKSRLLQQLPVEEVWGVGRKLAPRLARHGVQSVLDLRQAHVPTLRAAFGVVMEKVQRELQEIPCIALQEIEPARQQIIASRSFGRMVTRLPVLKDALSTFVANACAKLRAQHSQTALLQVFLQTDRFRQDLPQYMPSLAVPLPYPTDDSLEINRWAGQLCEHMFKPGYQYRKAGVMLGAISPLTHRQGDLLAPQADRKHRLMQALDSLNQRYGRGTVKVSTQGAFRDWQMRQERKSPNYTTAWDEVPSV